MKIEQLNGKWKLHSSHKFEEYMKALGESSPNLHDMKVRNN